MKDTITTYFQLNEQERNSFLKPVFYIGKKYNAGGMNNSYEKNKYISLPKKKRKKHFAQDAAKHYFPSAEDIPQVLLIPDKYDIIDSNVFAKLNLDNKRIRQIIIPPTTRIIKENAFAGLVVTEAVHISFNVKTIERNAFTLDKNAYIFCENENCLYVDDFREKGIDVITDVPFRSSSKDKKKKLQDLRETKTSTRIPMYAFQFDDIEEIIIPKGICVIEDNAFYNLVITKRIAIPSSVTRIGENAFKLGTKAYVCCDKNSFAHYYCSVHKIRNSADSIWLSLKKKIHLY